MYFPLVALHSDVIDRIATVLPSGAAFDALDASLAGRFPGGEALGVLAAYAFVFSAIAVCWLRWDVERSRTRHGSIAEFLTLSITIRGEITGEQVSRALREGLCSHYEVRPATRIKGRWFGTKPAGADATLVTTGATGLWRSEVTVVNRSGNTHLRIRPGGDPLCSALCVARKVRRVLWRDAAEVCAGPQATIVRNAGSREDKKLA